MCTRNPDQSRAKTASSEGKSWDRAAASTPPKGSVTCRAGLPVGGRVLCSLNPEVWLISLLKVLIDLRFNFAF